jgi:hypothetical protein
VHFWVTFFQVHKLKIILRNAKVLLAGAIGSNDFSIEASVNLQKDLTRAYRKVTKLQSASVSSNLIGSLAKPKL